MYLSLINRLTTQHQAIEKILSLVKPNRLTLDVWPGKWSIHENIAHLVRYQFVFAERINIILVKNAPFFERYEASADPGFESVKQNDIRVLLQQLKDDRKNIYEFLTDLSEAQLTRTGLHKKFGSLDIVQWTEFFLLHEAHHIFTIFQLAHETGN